MGLYYLDAHFKPLWASGPFCSIDFDVMGRIETYDEDTSYIIKALRLEVFYFYLVVSTSLFKIMENQSIQANSSKTKGKNECIKVTRNLPSIKPTFLRLARKRNSGLRGHPVALELKG